MLHSVICCHFVHPSFTVCSRGGVGARLGLWKGSLRAPPYGGGGAATSIRFSTFVQSFAVFGSGKRGFRLKRVCGLYKLGVYLGVEWVLWYGFGVFLEAGDG